MENLMDGLEKERTRPKKIYIQMLSLLAVIIWSPTFAFSTIALEVFSETVLSMLRVLMAAIFLIIFFLIRKVPLPEKKDLPFFLMTSAIGFSLYQLVFNKGMSTLTSATGSIIMGLSPIMTAIFAWICFRERIRIGGWIATFICFVGVVVLVLWDGILSINIGILWMLAVVVMAGAYNICQRKLTQKYTFIQATGYSIILASFMLLIFIPESIPQLVQASPRHWLSVLYLGVIPSAIAYLIWGWALSVAEKTSEVTVFMFSQPLFATIFGFLLIGEVPGLGTFIGAAIIIFGLLMFNAKK